MDYRLTLHRLGKGDMLYNLLKGLEDAFDTAVFEIEEVTKEGDEVHVDMEINIDRLVYQALLRVLGSRNLNLNKLGAAIKLGKKKRRRARAKGKFKGDDPKTPGNEAWEGGKSPKKPAARKRTRKKSGE